MKYNLNEFRNLINTNTEEAVNILNNIFINNEIDVNELGEYIGFSFGAIRSNLTAKGYEKQRGKGKGLIKIEEKIGVKNMDKKSTLTEDEILFIKELYKNKKEVNSEIKIKAYDDYKTKSVLISAELLEVLDKIYKANKQYKKQDILNLIIKTGIDNLKI